MDHEEDDPGTTWNQRAQDNDPEKMTARMAWRAIIKALPKEAIISSDIGNNCAIGNAYPTFEAGRKYLAPGMFGPCGYGFPPSWAPKSPSPTSRWSALPVTAPSAFHERDDRLRPGGMARHHHDHLPQLPVGCRKTQHHPLVRRQLRGHRTGTGMSPTPASPKPAAMEGVQAWSMDELTAKLDAASTADGSGKTTFIEVMTNRSWASPSAGTP
jgi:sulfoacetaldehyde acetyltransferase